MKNTIAKRKVSMSHLQVKRPTDTWVKATWDEYLQAIADPLAEKSKSYYFNGRMKIEMSPLGNPHASDHATIIGAIYAYLGFQNIDATMRDNCTFRKSGFQEIQPDISFYIGATAEAIAWESKIIDLDVYPSPTLAIEIADSSLADDKGEKRLLYEALNVTEYWIVDVQNAEILAFAIADNGSRKITQSQVLPGLNLSLLEEALQRCRQTNHGKVRAWLMTQFQQSNHS
jgi:Uma2 family endonuclease